MLQKVGMDLKLRLLSPMFDLGCAATSFLDLLISVERCTVNTGHNYKQHLFTYVCMYFEM